MYEVGVHIADVSYFVKEDTALDRVAGQRATSVYLVQRVRERERESTDQCIVLFVVIVVCVQFQ